MGGFVVGYMVYIDIHDHDEFIKCHNFNTPDINIATVRFSYYPPLPENSGKIVEYVHQG